jgi:hypothetical protein
MTKRQLFVSCLAYLLFTNKKIVFTSNNLYRLGVLNEIKEIIDFSPPDEKETLQILFNDFGIIIERAPEIYSFSHLTIQEYLTAKFAIDQRLEMDLFILMLSMPSNYFDTARYLARMLPKADHLIIYFGRNCDWSNREQVRLISAFFTEKPVVRVQTKRKFYKSTSQKVLFILKQNTPTNNLSNVRYCSYSKKLVFEHFNKTSIESVNNILMLLRNQNISIDSEFLDENFTHIIDKYDASSFTGAISLENWQVRNYREESKELWDD